MGTWYGENCMKISRPYPDNINCRIAMYELFFDSICYILVSIQQPVKCILSNHKHFKHMSYRMGAYLLFQTVLINVTGNHK